MGNKQGQCEWWEHHDDFSTVEYWTRCNGAPTKLIGAENDVARAVWATEAQYCPFCGDEIVFCDESEIIADITADEEYRHGVQYGLYGYGG